MIEVGKKRMWWYVGVLLCVSWACEIVLLRIYGLEDPRVKPFVGGLMFLPGLMALGYLLITKEGFRTIDWGIKKPIYLLFAIVGPALLALLCMFVLGALGIGSSTHFTFTQTGVSIKRGMFVLGKGEQSLWFFVLNYLPDSLFDSGY